jgi:hypothetical protein
MAAHLGRGMSVAFADYDGDGRMDAFVTNDGLPNFLFHNLGGGKFEETALLAGVALLDHGKPVASMGADFRDYDGDGLPDIVVTALNGETFPVFRNLGKGLFQDSTHASQIAKLSNSYAGWGVALADFDNDGRKDIFTSNSHVNDVVEQVEAAVYKQPNTVFRNAGGGKFAAVANSGLESTKQAHRGAAIADFDGDGKLDAVVTILGQPAELWRNVTEGAGNWIGIQLEGTRSNRDGIGAEVRLAGQHNTMTSSVSYVSSVVGPVHFGLGPLAKVDRIDVRWPSGAKQVITEGIAVNRILKIVEPRR